MELVYNHRRIPLAHHWIHNNFMYNQHTLADLKIQQLIDWMWLIDEVPMATKSHWYSDDYLVLFKIKNCVWYQNSYFDSSRLNLILLQIYQIFMRVTMITTTMTTTMIMVTMMKNILIIMMIIMMFVKAWTVGKLPYRY